MLLILAAARAETVCGEPAVQGCTYFSVEEALAAGASELELLEGEHHVAVVLDRPVTVRGRGRAEVFAPDSEQVAFVVTPGGSGSTFSELERVRGTLLSVEGAMVELHHVHSRARGQGTLARVQDRGVLTVSQPDVYDFRSPPGGHTLRAPLLVVDQGVLQVQSGVLATQAPLQALVQGVDSEVTLSHTLLLGDEVQRALSVQGGSLSLLETELTGWWGAAQALEAQGATSIWLESVSLYGFLGPVFWLESVGSLTVLGGELMDNGGPVFELHEVQSSTLQDVSLHHNWGDGVVFDGVGRLHVQGLRAVYNDGWVLLGEEAEELQVTHSLFCANRGAVSLQEGSFSFTYDVIAWDDADPSLQGPSPNPMLGNLLVDELLPPPAMPSSPEDCLDGSFWAPCPDCVDQDGDTVFAEDDCDDTRADVFPGAEEVKGDGVDQNCDDQEPCWEGRSAIGFDCDQDGIPVPLDCDDDKQRIGVCRLRWRQGCATASGPDSSLFLLGLWASTRRRRTPQSLDMGR